MTADGEVVMVRQYRHAAGESLLELPAGRLEPNEDLLDAARRELEEETGLSHVELDEAHPFEEAYTFTKRSGKQVSNRRLRETGFSLKFTDYRAGYGDLLNQQNRT